MMTTQADRRYVDGLKAALVDPRRVARALGLEITGRQARGVMVRCPWHNERTGSCSVTTGRDGFLRAHCFGCLASSDALGLVAAVHGLDSHRDFRRVLEIAARLTGVTRSSDAAGGEQERHQRPEPRIESAIFEKIAAVFIECGALEDAPDVARYLASRRLLDHVRGEWYAIRDTRALERKVKEVVGERAWLDSGLARKDGRLVWPTHQLVIPWRRPDGSIQTLQRRCLGDNREPKYVFPRGRAPAFPYGVERLASAGPAAAVAFVEGAADVVALRVLAQKQGLEWVPLGLAGVGAWDRSFALLARDRAAVVAVDDDPAGCRSEVNIRADLRAFGIGPVRRARPTGGKDWGKDLEVGL